MSLKCIFATCEQCALAIPAKDTYFGEKRYRCNGFTKPHKAIYARDCGQFQCREFGGRRYCEECSEYRRRK